MFTAVIMSGAIAYCVKLQQFKQIIFLVSGSLFFVVFTRFTSFAIGQLRLYPQGMIPHGSINFLYAPSKEEINIFQKRFKILLSICMILLISTTGFGIWMGY